jgi:hypothetical protein
MSVPDFVSETTKIRRKSYLLEASLKNFRDPSTDSTALLEKRFKELFGKDAGAFGPISMQIVEEDFEADRVEILVTGHVQYFVPTMKDAEDYLG